MSDPRVLLVGFDPRTVPGVDAAMVEMAIAIGRQRFEAERLEADECLLRLDDSAEGELIAALTRRPYQVVVIGGGIRKPEPGLLFFEKVVNLIRRHAPQAAIAFNGNPTDSVDAAKRWLAPG